ncbi:unnamed protein product [Nesidiocoris tenuis]|uniref:Uncharacterized protein n=1 Tax=Nesidiocoris tenuis TaxID=355587 RepID=A0A6H5FZB0_9HEMI|nr:unnamed protein product [Nesidiocoris tenuis]
MLPREIFAARLVRRIRRRDSRIRARPGKLEILRLRRGRVRPRPEPRPGEGGSGGRRQAARPVARHESQAGDAARSEISVPLPDGEGDRLVPAASGARTAAAGALPRVAARLRLRHGRTRIAQERHQRTDIFAARAARAARPHHAHGFLV